MPEIKQYTRQTQPTGFIQKQNAAGAFGDGGASGLSAMGDQLEQYAVKRAKSDYVAKMTQFQVENLKAQEELSKTDFGPDVDMSAVYQENLAARAAELDIHPLMGSQWQSDLASMKIGFAESGVRDGMQREAIRVEENWKNTLTNIDNFTAMGGTRAEAEAMLQAASDALPKMTSEQKSVLVNGARDELQSTEATRILQKNPYEFKRLANQGYFNDTPNLQQFIISADAEIERKNKAAQVKADEMSRVARGLIDPNSASDKKILDRLYQSIPSDSGEGSLNEDLLSMVEGSSQKALQFAQSYGIVPESMQSNLRGMMNNGSQEEKEFAYSLVGSMESINAAGFTDQEKKDAGDFNELTRAGISGTEAIESIKFTKTPEYARVREVYQARMPKDTDLIAQANQNIKEVYNDGIFGGLFNRVPEYIAAEAEADYSTVFKDTFLRFGNEEAAHARATKAVKNSYGQSELTGKEEIFKNPPEMFGVPDLSLKENRKWMQGQMKSELKEAGYSTNLDNYSLVPYPNNDVLISAGQQPAYMLRQILNEGDGSVLVDALKSGITGGTSAVQKKAAEPVAGAYDYVRDAQNQTLVFRPDLEIGKKAFADKIAKEEGNINTRMEREKAMAKIQASPNYSWVHKFGLERRNDAIDTLEALGIKK